MNYRINTKAITFTVVVLGAALGLFAYTLLNSEPQSDAPQVEEPVRTPTAYEETLSAKHQFKDGKHVVVGTVDVPTPCHEVTAEPFFVGESGDMVEIRITTSDPGGTCAQVVTPKPFKVTFEAPQNARLTALLDGTPVTLNLVPVGPEEDLNAFDVNVKG